MSDKMFESFFWIEPTKKFDNNAANKVVMNTKVVWHYPDDVSHLTKEKEFRDIPQFCFPGYNNL
jgi:hypothetical protein